jgi:hypothetical protein
MDHHKNPQQNQVLKSTYLCRSYRNAEECGRAVILVMAPYFSAEDIEKLLSIASENNQIYEARDTPNILAEVFDKTTYLLEATGIYWRNFVEKMTEVNKSMDEHYQYSGIRKRLSIDRYFYRS